MTHLSMHAQGKEKLCSLAILGLVKMSHFTFYKLMYIARKIYCSRSFSLHVALK